MERFSLSALDTDEPIKAESFIEITTPEGGTVALPVYVLQNGPSPRITFVGAHHSNEYCGADALTTLIQDFKDLDPATVTGSIVFFPVANVPGFPVRATNVSQFDGTNLNRSYPGNPDGNTSERIAHEIWTVAKTSDYVLDLHGGDIIEQIIQYAEIHLSTDPAVNRAALELVGCFDIESVLFSIAGTDYAYPDYRSLYGLAQEHGIPSAIVEAGSSGISDAVSVEYFRKGIRAVLASRGFLPLDDGQELHPGRRLWTTMGVSSIIRRNSRGMFKSSVRADDRVRKGQPIGEIRDFFGNVIDTIESPRNGHVSLVQSSLGKCEDDLLYMILDTDDGEWVQL